MKSLVIGYGSIGQRHARLLEDALGHEVAVVSRREIQWPRVFASIAEAIGAWDPGYVVIASRTDLHGAALDALAGADFKGKVLVEKPLFASRRGVPAHEFEDAFVAYNLRFHPVVQRLRQILETRAPLSVHAYVGQYLPDWRPGTDYRASASASHAHGGGVLRDLSHELDFLNWMLDGWVEMTALGGKFSALEIDSEDTYSILLRTNRSPVVTLDINYLDTAPARCVTVMTDGGSIRADLMGGTIDHPGGSETFAVGRDDTYIAEHRAVLSGETETLCSLDEGIEVVGMIDAAERAASGRVWVHR